MHLLISYNLLGGCPMCRLIQRGCLYTSNRGMGMAQPANHYTVLGVPRTATAAEIKHAYITKCKQHHPDTNSNPGSHETIVRVNAAYDVLGDPAKKTAYDQSLRYSYGGGQTINRSRSQPSRNHQDFRAHQNMNTSWENPPNSKYRANTKTSEEELFRQWIKTHHSRYNFGAFLHDQLPTIGFVMVMFHVTWIVILILCACNPDLRLSMRRSWDFPSSHQYYGSPGPVAPPKEPVRTSPHSVPKPD